MEESISRKNNEVDKWTRIPDIKKDNSPDSQAINSIYIYDPFFEYLESLPKIEDTETVIIDALEMCNLLQRLRDLSYSWEEMLRGKTRKDKWNILYRQTTKATVFVAKLYNREQQQIYRSVRYLLLFLVTDNRGNHRFPHTWNPPDDRQMTLKVATDALFNILVGYNLDNKLRY